MLTETRLHEKRHHRELRKRARRAGIVQARINRHRHKLRINLEDVELKHQEAREAAEKAAIKQTQRLVAAKQHTKAVDAPAGGLFRRLLNRVRGRG